MKASAWRVPDNWPEGRAASQGGVQRDPSADGHEAAPKVADTGPASLHDLDGSPSRGMVLATQATFRSGPLPTAQELGDYERASPGAALWILNEAEKSASHLRIVELQALRIESRDILLRRLLPFLVVFTFLVGSVLIALFASTIAGMAAFAATLASVVLVYLKGPANDAGQASEEPRPKS